MAQCSPEKSSLMNRSVRGEVWTRFDRSYGLDTALCKNVLLSVTVNLYVLYVVIEHMPYNPRAFGTVSDQTRCTWYKTRLSTWGRGICHGSGSIYVVFTLTGDVNKARRHHPFTCCLVDRHGRQAWRSTLKRQSREVARWRLDNAKHINHIVNKIWQLPKSDRPIYCLNIWSQWLRLMMRFLISITVFHSIKGRFIHWRPSTSVLCIRQQFRPTVANFICFIYSITAQVLCDNTSQESA